MTGKVYSFRSKIYAADRGGAYVKFPEDCRDVFGKGRVKVSATFDGLAYDGSIVNMGVKHPDGSICYILGMCKSIRQELHKSIGDEVDVTVIERT